jgi:hypothetical protein
MLGQDHLIIQREVKSYQLMIFHNTLNNPIKDFKKTQQAYRKVNSKLNKENKS